MASRRRRLGKGCFEASNVVAMVRIVDFRQVELTANVADLDSLGGGPIANRQDLQFECSILFAQRVNFDRVTS